MPSDPQPGEGPGPGGPGLTGLEDLRQRMAAGERPPMLALFGIALAEVSEGEVVFTATPDSTVYNTQGIVHGGFAATMLDTACGLAPRSAAPAPIDCLTLELKVAYHAPLHAGVGEVRAIGMVLSMGRRIAFTEGRLVDAAGKLYASATSTILLVSRKAAGG